MGKILITGGAGFIGSNLVESLGNVLVLDDFSSKNEATKTFLESTRAEIIEGNVNNSKLLSNLLPGVDTVYHLAAMASVPKSIENPGLCNKTNIDGTLAVLQASVKAGVKNIVLASTSALYGLFEGKSSEKKELSPQSPYAKSKLSAEKLLEEFSQKYPINTCSLRLFNVFGPRQDPNSEYAAVIPRFVKLARESSDLIIYGDGTQTRDFIYIKDVVDAFIKATGKQGVYNIASGNATCISSLGEDIIRMTKSNSKVRFLPKREGDIKHSLADISKAKKGLDWRPKYSLEEGLCEYISKN
jgi:UDP-glucose 4-epimerase